MVSYEATRKKYRGQMAAGYVAKRSRQIRWDRENEIVRTLLLLSEKQRRDKEGRGAKPGSVIDCPVGTGRFLRLYGELRLSVTGVDASEEMLAQARRIESRGDLRIGDATDLSEFHQHDHAVCVRFLDLLDEETMRRVVGQLAVVARRSIILTVRLGEEYVPKSNTATHDEKKFLALWRRLDWRVSEEERIFDAGWRVMRLVRR